MHILCLDENYSTTRLVTQEKPKILKNSDNKFETLLFLPEAQDRKGEGGLRLQGYFKTSQNSKPLISIITVVYNGEKYLEETISSVLNQTYDNVEYIIIDGGSSDKTLEIIKKYEDKIDYWVSERDRGIYDAMNKGISLCKGKIIGIVNADDYIYHETLAKVISLLQEEEIMFVYGKLDLLSEDGKIFKTIDSIGQEHIKYRIFKLMPFLHPTMFVKKSIYKQIGLFSTQYKLSADYDFTLKLIENRIKSKKLDFATGVFRLGGQSGGVKSYVENYKLLLHHGTNPMIVYFVTAILFIKLFFRKIINR